MKRTLGKIISRIQALDEFKGVKLNAGLSYKLSRLEDKASGIIKSFEATQNELIQSKYGELQPDGTYKVSPDRMNEFYAEINEVLSQEEDFDFEIKLSLFDGEKVSKDFFTIMGEFIVE